MGKKLNSQIAVIKNKKSLLEFLDHMSFSKDSAWPEASKYSSIRVGIGDYSNPSRGNRYISFNLSTGDIGEIADRLEKIPLYSAAFSKTAISELETLKKIFSKNPAVEPEELNEIEKSIKKLNDEIEEKTKMIVLYSAKKIIPYEKYKNPANDKEYQTKSCSILYNPSLRNPIVVEIGQGWATLIRKEDGTINFNNEHDYESLKKFISLSDFKKIIKKVQVFISSILQCGIRHYYEKSQEDEFEIFDRESQGIHGDINDVSDFDDEDPFGRNR